MTLLNQLWTEYSQNKDSHSEEAKEQALFKILSTPIDSNLYKSQQQDCQQIKEQVILELGNIYIKQSNPIKIQELIQKDVFSDLGKTKMAKVIRNLIDQVSQIENSTDIQIELCEYLQQWCIKQKRTYLRQRIEIKLANLLQQKKEFQKALTITEQLIKEVRKADDKHLMVEIQLVDSIIYYRIKNMAKAKASLTAARACSNQIYCPIVLQAEIDKMNGILLAEDKDYKTAYSYFYESFEAYNSLENPKALFLLKYMLLSKIMSNHIDDVNSILSSKHGLKYSSPELESMKQVSIAHSKKSLLMFQKVLDQYRTQIYDDEVVNSHIQCLYNNLLENNLKQIVEPYSKVQIGFVAENVNLDKQLVQDKLSEMILDKKIQGTLDQGNDCLILFDDLPCDDLYKNSIDKMNQMNLVVDKLFEKTKLLKTH